MFFFKRVRISPAKNKLFRGEIQKKSLLELLTQNLLFFSLVSLVIINLTQPPQTFLHYVIFFVKLHSKLANPTELLLDGVGVDFVFPPSQITTRANPTKIYQKEVYYRLGIWNIDLNHKTNNRLFTGHPQDGHLPSKIWAFSKGSSPTIPRKVNDSQYSHPPFLGWSTRLGL